MKISTKLQHRPKLCEESFGSEDGIVTRRNQHNSGGISVALTLGSMHKKVVGSGRYHRMKKKCIGGLADKGGHSFHHSPFGTSFFPFLTSSILTDFPSSFLPRKSDDQGSSGSFSAASIHLFLFLLSRPLTPSPPPDSFSSFRTRSRIWRPPAPLCRSWAGSPCRAPGAPLSAGCI